MTTVVNIKLTSDYDVYIGRPGKGQDGYFGNPHKIGFCSYCGETHDRKGCINAFRKYFNWRIKVDKEYEQKVLGLKGSRLGCFCKKPGINIPCHGDIYVEYLNGDLTQTSF